MNFHKRLRDLREDKDLKQSDIAQLLGTDQSSYAKYENGKHMMGIDKYVTLALFYNVSLDYLAGLSDTPRTLDGRPYQISKNITIGNINNSGKINFKV